MNEKLIALGVTGGIAAYKAAELCSLFVKNGYEVQVLMTENATRFVTPLTFRTLSRRPVAVSLWEVEGWRPEHVALADEAALFAVAPATANFLAKYAHGIADDALSTFAATFAGPVLIAPAMNPKMWAHPACRANVELLRSRGVNFCGPDSGRVACGEGGAGRLAEPQAIFTAAKTLLTP
ncbi:Coenzyme A biosynthesis bifunctional protein CoaBC [bioreactor metagenome]|uniref:Coenzyme A biosynthesis bifunctional protein CoaBC n=1 Tax=bioreactor metagenome TaxID=1076179 RepID=A0A645BY37_9ZZZZ